MDKALKLYKRYSPLMQSGDLIEWQSYGAAIGWAIRMITKKRVNHTSIVIKPKEYGAFINRRFLLEAMGGGVVPRLLSHRLKGYSGRVYWLPLNDLVSDRQREAMAIWAINECVTGKRYDYKSLFKNLTARVSVNAEQWFCSEYATGMFMNQGLIKKDVKAKRPGEFDTEPFIAEKRIIYDSVVNSKINQYKEESSK